MLRRLRLENWKAYESLDLAFESGATFVVAQNGVGKSSLIQGLIFGLYGEKALGFPAEQARRSGALSSTVEVTIGLPGVVDLVVARRIAAPSKSGSRVLQTVEATMNGERITADQFTRELSRRLGANLEQLPSLTVLREGDVLREADSGPSFNVVRHLSALLGVDRATSAAVALKRFESQQNRSGDAIRREDHGVDDTENLNQRHSELTASLSRMRQLFGAENESLTQLKGLLESANAWEAFKEVQDRDEDRLLLLTTEVVALMTGPDLHAARNVLPDHDLPEAPSPGSLMSLRAALAGAINFLRAADRRMLEERSATAALISRAYSAREALMEAGALCPVCRRPLSQTEAQRAAEEIDQEISELQRRSQSQPGWTHDFGPPIQRLVALDRQAHPAAALEPANPKPAGAAAELETLLREQEAKCDDIRLEGVRLRDDLAEVDRELSERNDLAQANVQSVKAYRRATIAHLAAATLRAVAEALCAQQIDPLARELHKRWEQLWPAPTDLRLDTDGQLSLRHGDEPIAFQHFSGGEKTMAVVMLRVLALQMLTRAGFLLLDEPLEHLDPRNRRMLAKLLVRASKTGPLDQVIVTTYEESVARALGSDALGRSSAAVLYVKTTTQSRD